METDCTILNSVELHLPLEFVKEAVIRAENDENFVFEKVGISPTSEEKVNLTFMNLKTHLKMTFEKLQFEIVDGLYQCIVNSLEPLDKRGQSVQKESLTERLTFSADKQHKSLSQEDLHSSKSGSTQVIPTEVKRKRGRPRKIKLKQISDRSDTTENKELLDAKKTMSCCDDESNDLHNCKENEAENIPNAECLPEKAHCEDGKRYSLRGRKINSQIMALVKGLDDNFSKTGNEDVDEIGGETMLMSDSDETVSKRVKKKTQKSYGTDTMENKDTVSAIKNKVEEILRSGNKLYVSKQCAESQINCKICEKNVCDNTALHEHVLESHENSEIVAEYLQEISKAAEELKLNENRCYYCGRTFEDRASLKDHESTDHKNEGFVCPLCDHKSKNMATLKIHVRNMHVEVGKKAFCHLCTASFRSQGSLRQHIDLNHYGNKHVSCDICKKQFYNKSQLRRHMRAHGLGGFRHFRCETCGKNFNFEYNLKRHIRVVHQPQSECFHCPYCGKGFSQKVPMISHVKIVHFNLFPYSCKECKDSFPKAVLLKQHMQSIHHQNNFEVPYNPRNSVYDKTEEDKFYCSYCNKSFTHKIRLIEHMHGDHADAFPYKCETCVQGFIERSFLVGHMLKAHGVLIQNEEETPKHSDSAGEIMQIITTKNGYPNKVIQAGEEMVTSENLQKAPDSMVSDGLVTKDIGAVEYVDDITPGSSQASSLLVEVEEGSNTYQYVIEAPESLSQAGSELAAQDIAHLLIAAGKTVQEGNREKIEGEPSTVQEISLVIDDSVQNHVESTGNQSQTVEFLLGQNDLNSSALTTDNQGQPVEVVINQTEESSAVFTIENQAQTLQIEHGDIIELNDSNSDGRNYYRIVNVLDNQ